MDAKSGNVVVNSQDGDEVSEDEIFYPEINLKVSGEEETDVKSEPSGSNVTRINEENINALEFCEIKHEDPSDSEFYGMSKYVRKTDRGKWSQEQLSQALEAIRQKNMAIRRASIIFGVPRKTLERYYKQKKESKGSLGPGSTFGYNNERRLAQHIIRMQNMGFPLTRSSLRSISFNFAQQLGIKNKFNVDKQKTGYEFVNGFLARNRNIKIDKSEDFSLASIQGRNRKEIEKYFELLDTTLKENKLCDKPSNIFNMDEISLQLKTRPVHVLARRGSKGISTTSMKKDDTVTVIACCNAEGSFLPPACIMKCKNKKLKYEAGMPPGAVLYMSPKSAHINGDIFYTWLKRHFIPQKPAGTVILIIDGHVSHCSVAVLQLADENDIIFRCVPSHTTHSLRPLDRIVFKSLKIFFYEEYCRWLNNNLGRRITLAQFGILFAESWAKTATQRNAAAGFSSTGTFPFNPSVVPNHAFISGHHNVRRDIKGSSKTLKDPGFKPPLKIPQVSMASMLGSNNCSPKKTQGKEKLSNYLMIQHNYPEQHSIIGKSAKQMATVPTSSNYISVIKENKRKHHLILKRKHIIKSNKFELDVISGLEEYIYDCVECGENYYEKEKIEEWLQCFVCKLWLHENCTPSYNTCNPCSIKMRRQEV